MKPTALLIADQIGRNLVMSVPFVVRWRSRRSRTAIVAAEPTREELDVYAYGPFGLVEQAVGRDGFRDAVVVEIGPGDHVPVALLALGAGARRYVAVDRFAGDIAGPTAQAFYAALLRDLETTRPELARSLAERNLSLDGFPERAGGTVTIVRHAVEEAEGVRDADVVFSNNTVEHVTDIAALGRATYAMLRPGGVAAHRVDFSAHDAWRFRDDPLEWLTISDSVWSWMGSRRGTPNRFRFHEVVEAFESAGFRVESRVLERYDPEVIRVARPRLARRFRAFSDESLSVRTAYVFCHKA